MSGFGAPDVLFFPSPPAQVVFPIAPWDIDNPKLFYPEKYGVVPGSIPDASANRPLMQDCWNDALAASGWIIYRDIYYVDDTLFQQDSFNGVQHWGYSYTNTGIGWTRFPTLGTDCVDCRGCWAWKTYNMKWTMPIDNFTGYVINNNVHPGGPTSDPKFFTVDGCSVQGALPNRTANLFSLAASQDVYILRNHLQQYTLGVDMGGGIGGGSANVNVLWNLFESGSVTHAPIYDPGATVNIIGNTVEPNPITANPRLVRHSGLGIRPNTVVILGNTLVDATLAAGQAYVDWNGDNLYFGPNRVYVNGGANPGRVIQITDNNLHGIRVDTFIDGNGIGIDWNGHSGHTGVDTRIDMPANGAQPQFGNPPNGPGGFIHGFQDFTSGSGQPSGWLNGTSRNFVGTGDPNSNVNGTGHALNGNKGDTFQRQDGGASTCFYVNETGTSTGWSGK